jgi:hypothetical protein
MNLHFHQIDYNMGKKETESFNNFLFVLGPVSKPDIKMTSSRSLKSNDLIAESSDVSLKCQTQDAYPYPSIQWFMNNQEL